MSAPVSKVNKPLPGCWADAHTFLKAEGPVVTASAGRCSVSVVQAGTAAQLTRLQSILAAVLSICTRSTACLHRKTSP